MWVKEVPQAAHALSHQTHLPTNHTHKCTHAHTLKHTCMYTHIYTYNIYLHYCTQTLCMKQQHITHKHIYIHLYTTHTHTHAHIHAYLSPVHTSFLFPKSSSSGFPAHQSSCHRLPSRLFRRMIASGIYVESDSAVLHQDSFQSSSDHHLK